MPTLTAIFGPTGTGKSEFGEAIADRMGARLINADAFQVYRGLDIGTNKSARKDEYALMDIRAPDEGYGVGEFVIEATRELWTCYKRGQSAIVVGGTGLYVRALFEEFKDMAPAPSAEMRQELQSLSHDELLKRLDGVHPSAEVDRSNRIRVQRALERALSPQRPLSFSLPPFSKFKVGIEVEPSLLKPALEHRTNQLLERGWIEEVKALRGKGVLEDSAAFRAIGYAEISRYLGGEMTFEGMVSVIQIQTGQYAKRQRAWMRSEPNLIPLRRERLGTPSVSEIEATLNQIK